MVGYSQLVGVLDQRLRITYSPGLESLQLLCRRRMSSRDGISNRQTNKSSGTMCLRSRQPVRSNLEPGQSSVSAPSGACFDFLDMGKSIAC